MDIAKRQNEKDSLELLAAQRFVYSIAKKFRNPRIWFSLILTAIAPIIIILFPTLKIHLGIIGGVWAIIAYLLSLDETKKVKIAATIQEEFDTHVFALDWNEILVGHKVSHEIIHNYSLKYKDKSEFQNWYGDLKGINNTLSILICQRSNLVWDWRLRRTFARVIIVFLSIFLIAGIIISTTNHLALDTYLLSILLPSASAYILGVKEIIDNFNCASSKESLEKKIYGIWEKCIENSTIPGKSEMRQIQDRIYLLRTNTALIPDYWYNKYKSDYETSMQGTIDKYKKQALNFHISQ